MILKAEIARRLRQDEVDEKEGEAFGVSTSQIAGSSRMSRGAATFFVLLFFYRRLLQAVITLGLYNYPAAQVILTMLLQLGYLCFILHFSVFKDRAEARQEIFNEVFQLLTIYFLMIWSGDFIQSLKVLSLTGIALIVLTGFNFIFNLIPLGFSIKIQCRSSFLNVHNTCKQRSSW